jgi:hypothetical protein
LVTTAAAAVTPSDLATAEAAADGTATGSVLGLQVVVRSGHVVHAHHGQLSVAQRAPQWHLALGGILVQVVGVSTGLVETPPALVVEHVTAQGDEALLTKGVQADGAEVLLFAFGWQNGHRHVGLCTLCGDRVSSLLVDTVGDNCVRPVAPSLAALPTKP